ncbi:MAG: hypothetical protein Q9208_004191 [Pyrenodesmia sp. 3 TL-2023]
MDPVSVLSIISSSTTIALQCGKAVRNLHEISERYKYAELSINSMSIGLDTIQCAWRRIRNILQDWAADENKDRPAADTELLMQLARSLDGGMLVISTLVADLRPFLLESSQPIRLGFWKKTQFVWDDRTFKDHQDRVRDQVNSINLLISVLQLDGLAVRRQRLLEGQQTLQRSDESAYALVLSRASSSQDSHSLLTLSNEEPLVYRELSIDRELFSADVYSRSSRSPIMRNVLHSMKPVFPALATRFKSNLGLKESGSFSPPPHKRRLTKQRRSDGTLSAVSSKSSSTQMDVEGTPPGWVSTEWMVGENQRGNRCIAGPNLSQEFIDRQPMGHMKTKTLCQFKLHFAVANRKIDFNTLFDDCSSNSNDSIGFEWLQHCAMTACLLGDLELLRMAIGRDTNLCSMRCEGYCYAFDFPVELAYRKNNPQIVKLLLESSSHVMDQCHDLAEELLHEAISTSDKDLLSLLLQQDSVDVRYRYAVGGQAAHVACRLGSLECLGLLIEAGADLGATDRMDSSAFQYLARILPPETAILGWIPISGMERAEILHSMLRLSPDFVRPTDGPVWPGAYIKAIQSIGDYLLVGDAVRYLEEFGPGCCSSEFMLNRFEQHLPESVKRYEVMAALESIRQGTRRRAAPNPTGIAVRLTDSQGSQQCLVKMLDNKASSQAGYTAPQRWLGTSWKRSFA